MDRMDKNTEKKWENIQELLAQTGGQLNILEEEVDVTVQQEYFALVKTMTEDRKKYKLLCKQYIEGIDTLFDPEGDEELKKRMLVVLATVDDITIFRAIESFSKEDTALKKWAVIALQQSRMLIQTNLMDDPGVFISTGLGGQGLLLRYFCVFLNRAEEKLQEFQQTIVRNETESALTPLKGVIEQMDFFEEYSTAILLLPIDADLRRLFEAIIEECNTYGNFLHENMIITNVKKLSSEEILDLLKRNNKHKTE